MTEIDTAKLRERAEKATPGPWFPETYSDGHRQVCGNLRPIDDDEDAYTVVADVFKREDHEYLVAVDRDTILALLDRIEAAERERDEYRIAADCEARFADEWREKAKEAERALQEIAEQEHIELMLDPTWAQRVAKAAIQSTKDKK